MKRRTFTRKAGLILAAVIALAGYGCGNKSGVNPFSALAINQRPTVEITSSVKIASSPAGPQAPASYSVRIDWAGNDRDGRVAYYTFAIDPGDRDTIWHATRSRDTTLTFVAKERNPNTARSESPHTFVVKAYDDGGMSSAPEFRSFFSNNIAPVVRILSPLPSDMLMRQLTPTMTIVWDGSDPDGYLMGVTKPIYYRYKVFEQGNAQSEAEFSFALLRSNPDSLRRFYAKENFASWTKTGRGLTSVTLSGQTVGHEYVFAVVAFDTVGDYSPVFNFTTNMLQYEVGFAATLGPVITSFNESYYYTMPSGGYTPNNPLTWQHLEVPAANKTTFNWFATPPSGSTMQSYRWRLGGNVLDETPRTNETTDWYHWSARALGTTSCSIGPFQPGFQRFLYIEAMDSNGLKSLLTIVLHPVQPTFASDLLIVDDTRLEADQFYSSGAPVGYASIWPSAAELDTFLYARGGVPWRGTVTPGSPMSKPGLFAGYSFDTLGTRLGLINPANGVPLSLLGRYRHVIWIVDPNGASNAGSPIDPVRPEGTLRYMCTPNHVNTLGTYISAGGSVWLLGGDAAKASLIAYDVTSNNAAYGGGTRIIWSNTPTAGRSTGELVPGRLMYDAAHWRSELAAQSVAINATTVIKSTAVPNSAWTSPGWNFGHPVSSPDYSLIPATMRRKSLSLGDSMPPTRTNSGADQTRFYTPAGVFDLEYMTQPNSIIEDDDPDAFAVHEVSTLDTLMDGHGLSLASTGNRPATMTYYHGMETPEFVFSGFDIWRWHRADDQALVDFVLQSIWRLPYNPSLRTLPLNGVRPAVNASANTRPGSRPAAAGSRLPSARTAGR